MQEHFSACKRLFIVKAVVVLGKCRKCADGDPMHAKQAHGPACECFCVAVQGIPTTRAGSIVTSDTMIVRDPLYTGDPIEERASVVLRIAPSFFRFGSFEIFNHTDIKTGRHSHPGAPSVGPGRPPAVTPAVLSPLPVQCSDGTLLEN